MYLPTTEGDKKRYAITKKMAETVLAVHGLPFSEKHIETLATFIYAGFEVGYLFGSELGAAMAVATTDAIANMPQHAEVPGD
jgi:hypothetical protein